MRMNTSMTNKQWEAMYYARMELQRDLWARDMYLVHHCSMGQKEVLLFLGLLETACFRRLP